MCALLFDRSLFGAVNNNPSLDEKRNHIGVIPRLRGGCHRSGRRGVLECKGFIPLVGIFAVEKLCRCHRKGKRSLSECGKFGAQLEGEPHSEGHFGASPEGELHSEAHFGAQPEGEPHSEPHFGASPEGGEPQRRPLREVRSGNH